MTTIAAIAAEAFDGVALDITDAIPAATLVRTTLGAYDAANDTHEATTTTQTGRAVITGESPKPDMFPAYVVGPQDQLILLEGFTSARENDALTVAGVTRTIMAVQDIGGAGSLFYVVAR